MNIGQIKIKNGNYPEITFTPQEYNIVYDSLAGPASGRSIDGSMKIDWILNKTTKLEVTLPPHKYNDDPYSKIASHIQGQVVKVSYFDYLTQTYVTNKEMYCSQVTAGYSYLGYVHDVSFELIDMGGEKTWNIPTITLYTITVNGGTGSGQYPADTWISLIAQPDEWHTFLSWSDGNTENPRPHLVTGDATFTAQYQVKNVTLTASGEHCTITGAGTYPYGTTVTLTCTPDSDYAFTGWSDGNTSNPRSITLTGDTTLSAYTTTLYKTIDASGEHCTITGAGTYTYGSTCTLTCIPDTGYTFTGWSDGNTDNPRVFTVTQDVSYTAINEWTISDYFWIRANSSESTALAGIGYNTASSTITAKKLYYSTDLSNWSEIRKEEWISVPINTKVYFKGGPDAFGEDEVNCMHLGFSIRSGAVTFEAGGSIMSLFEMNGPVNTLPDWALVKLFVGDDELTSISQIIFPSITSPYCYYGMFKECEGITDCPALPATTLSNYCYALMFSNCTSLTQIPALPATSLPAMCYANMFNGTFRANTSETTSYPTAYRIPYTGTGTDVGTQAMVYMFTNRTPNINTTYYVSATSVV